LNKSAPRPDLRSFPEMKKLEGVPIRLLSLNLNVCRQCHEGLPKLSFEGCNHH
jgi:hypothetical protein